MRRFFRRVRRVIDFLPIIWKGEDYDYKYAIDLFSYQLKRTAEFLESDRAYTLDSKIQARRIRTAIELMQKVYDEEYVQEVIDNTEEGSWIEIHEALEKQDKAERIVWKFIAHNIRKWWD